LLYGPHFLPTVDVLRWMAFVPFMFGMADVFGVQTLLPLGMTVQFSRVLIAAAIFNLTLLLILSTLFAERGAAAAVLLAQTFVGIAMATTLHINHVPFFAKCRIAK
jgi:PST family polysaccharide transporter